MLILSEQRLIAYPLGMPIRCDGAVVIDPDKDQEVPASYGDRVRHPHPRDLARLPWSLRAVPDEFRYLAALMERMELKWDMDDPGYGEATLRRAYDPNTQRIVWAGQCSCGQGFYRWGD